MILVFSAPHVRAHIGEVFAGDHSDHSGQRFRLPCIDREDACMRVRAAQKLSFDHAGDDKITGVPGPAGYLVGAVNALHRCADDGEITLFSPQVKPFLFPERSS
jgi:hypothetical protein